MKEIQAKTRSVRAAERHQVRHRLLPARIQVADQADGRAGFRPHRGVSGRVPTQHERKDVASYGHYFLGSIVISQPDEKKQIVDGQQRLTSLTLLLIYLHNIQKDRHDAEPEKMIFSGGVAKVFQPDMCPNATSA
jgi:hypothetical protein